MKSGILATLVAALLSVFGGHQIVADNAAVPAATDTAIALAGATTSDPFTPPAGRVLGTQTVSTATDTQAQTARQKSTSPKIASSTPQTVSLAMLAAVLAALEDKLTSNFRKEIAAINPPHADIPPQIAAGGSGGGYLSAPAVARIDSLTNTSLRSVTVSGVSGLTDADIPDGITASNYLPLAGGTLTGALTATDLTVSGNLTVSGAQTLSGAISVPYLTATSTTATSTFVGAVGIGTTSPSSLLSVHGNGYFAGTGFFGGTLTATSSAYLATAGGSVGIATTSPWGLLSINPNGISGPSLAIGSSTATHFVVTNGGDVGIGTTTPGALLSAAGNILGAGTLALTGTTGTTTIATGQGFTIGGSQFVVQQGSGNVGLGTATPAANFMAVIPQATSTTARFEIQRDSSPLNYQNTRAAFVLQQRDSANGGNNEISPGAVFQFNSTGSGVVNAGSDLSLSIWSGLFSAMTKSGDGSAHTFTGTGQLGAVGAGGYNELGAFQAELTNIGSSKGTMSGLEVLLKDSPDSGGSTYNTKMEGVVSRLAKYNSTTRLTTHFFASSEGSLPPSSILSLNSQGLAQWQQGIDFSNGTFTTGRVLALPNNTNIGWKDTLGTVRSNLFVSNTNDLYVARSTSTSKIVFSDESFSPLMLISANGNVGIGTTTPWGRLAVNQDYNGSGPSLNLNQPVATWSTVDLFRAYRYIQTNSAATDGNFKQFNVGAGGVGIGYNTLPAYGSGDALYVNGAVGIGTTTPQQTLSVVGNFLLGGGGADNRIFTKSGDGTITTQLFAFDGLGGYVGTNSNHKFMIRTNDTDRMTFDTSGNVGIGTTTPFDKLNVYGNSTAGDIWIGNLFSSSYNSIYLNGTSGGGNFNFASSKVDTNLYINRPSGKDIVFQENNVTGGLYLKSGGNVGIGTTSPLFKLDVDTLGTVNGVRVSTAVDQLAFRAQAPGATYMELNNTTAPSGSKFLRWANSGGALVFEKVNDGYSTAAELMRLDGSTGNVGIGTTTPGGVFAAVTADTSATSSVGWFYSGANPSGTSFTRLRLEKGVGYGGDINGYIEQGVSSGLTFNSLSGGSSVERVRITNSGNVGIGTGNPTAQLHTTGTVRFSNFGAGTLTTDASGNVSVSSDERLKNVDAPFTRGLADIVRINPISYHWKGISGLDQSTQYSGFSAQNVQQAIPEAVGSSTNGYLTLQDRPLIAALVNAAKEIATITGTFKSNLVAWLGDTGNEIGDFFARRGHFGELCVDDICVTREQFAAIVAAAGRSPAVPSDTSTATSVGAPIIEINGNATSTRRATAAISQ